MSNSILTVAQIGCGKFAQHQDLPNLSTHKQVKLKWVCDINAACAGESAEKFNVPNFTDNFMDIINDPEVDMIKIATSHEAHLPIIEAAAAAGKHIFCEKPMAKTYEDGCRMVNAAEKNGKMLNIFQQSRFAPFYVKIKEILANDYTDVERTFAKAYKKKYDEPSISIMLDRIIPPTIC